MKPLIRQITSVGFALLLLFSTLSFHLDLHFCGNHLMDFSLTDKAPNCGMEISANGQASGCIMAVMNCCSDVKVMLHGQDGLTFSTDSSFATPPIQWAALTVLPPCHITALPPSLADHNFKDYSPPPLIRKVHLLYETFLI